MCIQESLRQRRINGESANKKKMGKGRRCVKEGTEEWNMMMGMIF